MLPKREKITLRNSFHGTECRVIVEFTQYGVAILSRNQTSKVKNTLCGLGDCSCGTFRGPQDVKISSILDNDRKERVVLERKEWI